MDVLGDGVEGGGVAGVEKRFSDARRRVLAQAAVEMRGLADERRAQPVLAVMRRVP
jgi:hypothetical protein